MGKYSYDMKGEKEPTGSVVFDEGWHTWEVVKIENKVSQSGNEMFVIELAEELLLSSINVYAVAVEGKRWLLKQFLAACGIKENAEGLFDWDSDELIGKRLQGYVENEPNEWIDREGRERKSVKSKISKFKAIV